MRRLWLPLLLVAGPAVADPIPEGADVDPEVRGQGGCSCEISTPKVLEIRGRVYAKTSGQPANGATIIVLAHGGTATYPAIADERGDFRVDAPPGIYDITVYYVDSTMELVKERMFVDDTVLDPILMDDTGEPHYDCWYIGPHVPPAELSSMPHFGGTSSRTVQPVSRDRTHRAWIAPIAFADPVRAVTSIDGTKRFTGAPGIPLAFVDDVTTYSRDVPLALSAGSGGATDVALRYGSNQRRAEARLIGGVDDHADGSAAAETFIGGPLAKDHAWAAAGLVLRRDARVLTGDGMLRLDGKTDAHEVSVVGIGHDGIDEDAGWTRARWKATLLEAKLELGANLTGERLERTSEIAARETTPGLDPVRAIDRAGGLAYAKLRFKAAGYHIGYASVGGGGGRRDELRHDDTSVAVGDDWMWTPSVTFTTGVRVERRTFDGDRATVVAPRATLKWDPTREGRSEVYVGYQRVPLLDDGLPGDWKSLEVNAVDELSAGVAYRRSTGDTMVGLAVRQRDDRTGGDAWIRRDTARSVIQLQATSIERVATLLAQRKLRDRNGTLITLGTAARASEDRSEAGVALGWKRSPGRSEVTAEVAAEGYAGTAGPGGRVVVGILW